MRIKAHVYIQNEYIYSVCGNSSFKIQLEIVTGLSEVEVSTNLAKTIIFSIILLYKIIHNNLIDITPTDLLPITSVTSLGHNQSFHHSIFQDQLIWKLHLS